LSVHLGLFGKKKKASPRNNLIISPPFRQPVFDFPMGNGLPSVGLFDAALVFAERAVD
jgi:hypothetical protein